jgi:glycosyltransferase involved in cell wall biosynthesis
MKVHVYGNALNSAFNMTRFLRAKGVDAEMFLDDISPFGQDYPWWEDKNLSATNLPPWIHYYPSRPFFLRPNKVTRRMIADFSRCDVALVCGMGPILAMKAKVPFILYAIGSDLNALGVGIEVTSLFRSRMPMLARFKRLVKLLTYSPFQIRAIEREADKVLVLMGYQVNPLVNKYGLAWKTSKARLPWDTLAYASPLDQALYERYKIYDTVFFMIARHSWRSVWDDTKGNDKFIRAYARFVKEFKPNARLITISKGIDVGASRRLIDDLGIGSYVEWVSEMDKNGIRSFESLPNCVVVDQFWHNEWYRKYPEDPIKPVLGFGCGSIEALSAGRPLITTFTDEAFYEGHSPPILSAFTEDEIYRRIVQVHSMNPEERRDMGEAGRAFVYQWHDWRNVTTLYIDALEETHRKRRSLAG